jgi:hypothetical protein
LADIVGKPEAAKLRLRIMAGVAPADQIGATEMQRREPPKPVPPRTPRPQPPVTWRFTDWAMI